MAGVRLLSVERSTRTHGDRGGGGASREPAHRPASKPERADHPPGEASQAGGPVRQPAYPGRGTGTSPHRQPGNQCRQHARAGQPTGAASPHSGTSPRWRAPAPTPKQARPGHASHPPWTPARAGYNPRGPALQPVGQSWSTQWVGASTSVQGTQAHAHNAPAPQHTRASKPESQPGHHRGQQAPNKTGRPARTRNQGSWRAGNQPSHPPDSHPAQGTVPEHLLKANSPAGATGEASHPGNKPVRRPGEHAGMPADQPEQARPHRSRQPSGRGRGGRPTRADLPPGGGDRGRGGRLPGSWKPGNQPKGDQPPAQASPLPKNNALPSNSCT